MSRQTRKRDRRARRAGRAWVSPVMALAVGLAAIAGGCRTYEREPLDMSGHREAFLARTPETPEVLAFASELSAREAGAAAAFDLSDGVSCAEAEVVALVYNAELRLTRLRAGVTRATADNAGLWEDPSIGVDLTRILESTPEPWKVFGTVGITIPISGRLKIERELAGVEHAAELARVAAQEWSVRMRVRRAWSEWSGLEAELEATQEFLARADAILDVVDAMEGAGEMARTEARLFRIERATRAAERASLEARVSEASLRLRGLMGMSPDAPFAFRSNGIGPGRSVPGARVGGTARRTEFEASNPAMVVAAAEHDAAERLLELEIRKQYPDLHIGPGYGREDGQDQLLFGVSLPVPVLNGNRQGIAEAVARREVARASAEATLEQVISALRAAEVRLGAAEARRRVYEEEIVPLVDAQYADARRVASLGEVNTIVILESLTRQQDAKMGLIAAMRDEALASIDVEELIGPESPDGSGKESGAHE